MHRYYLIERYIKIGGKSTSTACELTSLARKKEKNDTPIKYNKIWLNNSVNFQIPQITK